MEQKVDLSVECFREEVIEGMQQIFHKLGEIEDILIEKTKVYNKPSPDKDVSYQNKRNTYLAKLNNNEILYPKSSTLEYYKIKKENDKYS